jgi:hypothetical protein
MIFDSGDFLSARTPRGWDTYEARGARRAAKRTKQFLLAALMISLGVFVVACAQRPNGAPSLDEPEQPVQHENGQQKRADEAPAAQQQRDRVAASAKGRAAAPARQALVDVAAAKPLTCGYTRSTSSYVVFHDAATYSATSFVGDDQSTWSLKWSVINNYTMGHSGNLRAELYAMPESASTDSFDQTGWSGHRIAVFYPKFSGEGTYSTDQLNALWHWDDIVGSVTTTNPPIGKYCIVVFLFERKDSCKDNDHYCWDAWMQFPTPQLFN